MGFAWRRLWTCCLRAVLFQMIDEMITKLIEQANEEATHKGWCDTEMAKNTQTRETKTDEINTLTAKADKLSSAITRVAQEIADLQAAITEIDAAVAKAVSVRAAETKKNKETVEDSQKAQAAVTAALNVLKDFYAKAAQATAFVQTKQPEIDAPKTFEGSYTGMGDSSGVRAGHSSGCEGRGRPGGSRGRSLKDPQRESVARSRSWQRGQRQGGWQRRR